MKKSLLERAINYANGKYEKELGKKYLDKRDSIEEKIYAQYIYDYVNKHKSIKQRAEFLENIATEVFKVKIVTDYLETHYCISEVWDGTSYLLEGRTELMKLFVNNEYVTEEKVNIIDSAIENFNKHLKEFGIEEYSKFKLVIFEIIIGILKVFNSRKERDLIGDRAVDRALDEILEEGIEVLDITSSMLSHCNSAFLSAGYVSEAEMKENGVDIMAVQRFSVIPA